MHLLLLIKTSPLPSMTLCCFGMAGCHLSDEQTAGGLNGSMCCGCISDRPRVAFVQRICAGALLLSPGSRGSGVGGRVPDTV